MDAEYLKRVMTVLGHNPTAADIDFLIEAYSKVSYLAADAEGLAEAAENTRKYEEANAYLKAKQSGEKVTERQAEAQAAIAVQTYRDAEVEARVKFKKIANLMDSIRECVNAIKFLGRSAG